MPDRRGRSDAAVSGDASKWRAAGRITYTDRSHKTVLDWDLYAEVENAQGCGQAL